MPGKHAKPLLVLLTLTGVCGLAMTGANPLERVRIFQRVEGEGWFQTNTRTITSEHDTQLPWDFDPQKDKRIAVISRSYALEKWSALAIVAICSSSALVLATALQESEALEHVTKHGKLELSEDALKFKFAKARKSQQLLHQQDLHELAALVGGSLDQQVDEELASNKFMNAAAIENELGDRSKAVEMAFGAKKGTPEHEQFQSKYEEWLEKDE